MVKKQCLHCGIEFEIPLGRANQGQGKVCSRKCHSAHVSLALLGKQRGPAARHWIEQTCVTCGATFRKKLSERKIHCNIQCAHNDPEVRQRFAQWQQGKPKPRELIEKIKATKQSPEFSKRTSEYVKAAWQDPEKRARILEGIKRRSESEEWRAAPHFQREEAHPRFKGNIRARREANRYEGKLWRTAVFTRDAFTCQRCGAKGSDGTRLVAHHIEPWATCPERRFDVDNGLTLCEPCHAREHGKEYRERFHHCKICGKPKKDGRRPRCLECGRKHLPLPAA